MVETVTSSEKSSASTEPFLVNAQQFHGSIAGMRLERLTNFVCSVWGAKPSYAAAWAWRQVIVPSSGYRSRRQHQRHFYNNACAGDSVFALGIHSRSLRNFRRIYRREFEIDSAPGSCHVVFMTVLPVRI